MAQTNSIWIASLFLILIYCLPVAYGAPSPALPIIDLSSHESGQPTSDQYLYTREYDEYAPFDLVVAEGRWQRPNKGEINRGFSDNPSWMAFALKSPSQGDHRLIVEYVDASAQSIDVYYRKLSSNDDFQHLHYGFDLPVETRPISFHRPAFMLTLDKDSTYEVFIRIFQGNEMTMHCFTSFRLWSEAHFYRNANIEILFLTFLICLEIFMAIAAIIAFASTRDKLFLYYAVFVFSAAGLFAGLSGFWGYFVMPHHYELWMVVLKINICQIAALLFIRRFLLLSKISTLADRSILLLVTVGFIGVLTNVLGYPDISRVTADFIAMFYLLLIPIGLYAYKKGVQNALLFTFSWLVFIMGMVLASMRLSGLLPSTPFTEWMIYVGGFLEVTLLGGIMLLRIHAMNKERKAIKKELHIALENAQENNNIKDKFLSVFSHELRTPLNGILGSLQLLEFSPLSDEQKRHKDTADRSARNLLRLLENILTFSELTSNKARSVMHHVHLKTNIQGIINSFQHAAKAKHLTLSLNTPEHLPDCLLLDWPNIQKILTYWIDNAIKFSDKGEVSIVLSCTEVEVSNRFKIQFDVRDQGCGIDEKTLNQISDGFKQKDSNTIKKIEGLGLGLANSIKIAELINAHCHVESSDKGTTCHLEVICQRGEEKRPTTQTNSNQKVHVLAVDDNQVNLLVLTQILQNQGMVVDQATNGLEALHKTQTTQYQAIFMDCQMPVMDGYQATRSIRETNNLNCSTPIIAVTANAFDSDREHCLYVGMNDFVSKPINKDAIMDAYHRWC